MNKDNLIVSNIQRVCFHDGPGIRTTVFLHGCSLKCPWCANPEMSFFNRKYIVNHNCKMDNGKCIYGVDCTGIDSSQEVLEENYNKCPVGAIEKIYDIYSIDNLKEIILEDKFLYGNDGGVTFSGGEPLLQSKKLKELLIELKKESINIAIESCLYVDNNNLLDVIDYIDTFIIDVKILNKDNVKTVLNGDFDVYLKNIDAVFSKNKNVIFRVPLIKPYGTDDNNLSEICHFFSKYKPNKVEIFKGHNLAREKYKKLRLDYSEVETLADEEIEIFKNKISDLGIDVEMISL